jgi:microcystin-dependent protein
MSQQYLAQIMMFGGNFAINGWAMCNGQTLSISQNSALFSILGTSFGGNGTTNFVLPDFRGRIPLGPGQGIGLSNYVSGEFGGAETVILAANQMPLHTHLVNADGQAGGKTSPQGNVPGTVSALASEKIYSGNPPNTTMNPAMIGSAGGNSPVSIVQPYLCVTFLIALVGIFPSRN